MSSALLEPQIAADILFYEAEAADGFLSMLISERVFSESHWQRLWTAVASLFHHNNGGLDTWETYDLAQIVNAIQRHGQTLVGRKYDSLDEFELRVLEANAFLHDILD
jgi:hypothetical protein